MSTLIPSITLSELKKLKAEQIKKLKSCEITSEGEYLCTLVIPPTEGGISVYDHVRTHAESASFSGNSIGGKEISELNKGVNYAGDK